MTSVVSLRADKVRVPFRRPFPWAQGMWLEREAWIIRLVDADGRIGLGEAVLEPADGDTASTVLDHLVHEAAMMAPGGRLPTVPELEMQGSPGRALRAAIDAARLDLEGVPAECLVPGGAGVGVNATIASIGPEASARAALQAVHAGFTSLKLKAGAERETEVLVERVRAVRTAVGPDVRLRLDVNGVWDLETATDRLDAVARFALEYVEQPLAGDDAADLAELRRRVRIPIAADETVTSLRAARVLLDAGAVDVLVVKPARVGGPVAAAEIAALAAERNVPVVVSTLFETGVGIAAALAVAAALPSVQGARLQHAPDHGLATAGVLEHDLLVDGLPVEEGRMRVPGVPAGGGLGITLDERAMARFLVESAAGG
ncbi:MAG TPA: mandelate racemase/muconate lactonizing enzyme family protein [Candidatus Limnocylindrales bacterium]